MDPLKISIIGLGNQTQSDHIPSILENDRLRLISVCDIDSKKLDYISETFNIKGFLNFQDLLLDDKPDICVVSVPHSAYINIIPILCIAGVHILKEKPFAINIAEANEYHRLLKSNKVKMMIGLQRRYHPIYQAFVKLQSKIGRIYSIEGRFTLNVNKLDEGWRSESEVSGGGALVDMGYHYIDLLIWYFGLPDSLSAYITLGNREDQKYDVEDTACINLEYFDSQTNHRTIGSLFISRAYPRKEESLLVLGSKGSIELTRGKISRYDSNAILIETLERKQQWLSAYVDQLDDFIDAIENDSPSFTNDYTEHYKHLAFTTAAYKSQQKNKIVSPIDFYRTIVPNNLTK